MSLFVVLQIRVDATVENDFYLKSNVLEKLVLVLSVAK